MADGWTSLVMEWDFENGTVSSWYGWQDGIISQIDINNPLVNSGETLFGWYIWLAHNALTGTGSDVVLIDNFWIYGSEIYDSYGFEDFAYGEINGQSDSYGTWTGGAYAVPVPPAVLLMASGLSALFMTSRRPRA